MTLPTYESVLAAAKRLEGHVRQTPVFAGTPLDQRLGARLFFKAECLQYTGSFKIRGAMNRLLQLNNVERSAGVVAFSSGNHAQGISRAARLLGIPALIVMPEDAPRVKVQGVEADGASIHFYDRVTESREKIATRIAAERGAVLVPSFDDVDIISGQGTVGLEFAGQLQAMDEELDHLVCCAGGGGLISGIALAFSRLSPTTKIWTAEPEGHDDWARSLETGERISNAKDAPASICDAILTPVPGEITFALGRQLFAGGMVAGEEDIRMAMKLAFRNLKLVVEPGGAAALAALLRSMPANWAGKRIGVVLSGGNVDSSQFCDILAS